MGSCTAINPLLIGYGQYPDMPAILNPYVFADPMSGVPLLYLFRSHLGDKVPAGMYQDTAGSAKSVSDGDIIKRATDGFSPIALTQSDGGQSFTLRFAGDGTPYMEAALTGILFETTISASQPFTIIVAIKQPSPVGANSGIAGSNGGYVGMYVGAGQTTLRGLGSVNLFSTTDLSDWLVADAFFNGASSRVGDTTGDIGSGALSGFSLNGWAGGDEKGNVNIVAVAIITDDSYADQVKAHFAELLPSP